MSVSKLAEEKLSKTQLRILEFLKTYKDGETGLCTPPIREIAQAVGLSRNYAQKVLRELADHGVIEISERWYDYDDPLCTPARIPNLYKIVRFLGVFLIGFCLSAGRHYVSFEPSQEAC